MLRAARVVQLVCLALILGVLVLHIPLDAFRAKADGCLAASCCASVEPTDSACDDCEQTTVGADASAPTPKDGCDQGCHCGCCGGLPLAVEGATHVVAGLDGTPSSLTDRAGARRSRPFEIFHPPRA